jgi:hypothetical protein
MELDEIEPSPYEYAELERECETSDRYRMHVAGAALRIAARRTGMGLLGIGTCLGMKKSSVYRVAHITRVRKMGRNEFEGILHNVANLIESFPTGRRS